MWFVWGCGMWRVVAYCRLSFLSSLSVHEESMRCVLQDEYVAFLVMFWLRLSTSIKSCQKGTLSVVPCSCSQFCLGSFPWSKAKETWKDVKSGVSCLNEKRSYEQDSCNFALSLSWNAKSSLSWRAPCCQLDPCGGTSATPLQCCVSPTLPRTLINHPGRTEFGKLQVASFRLSRVTKTSAVDQAHCC